MLFLSPLSRTCRLALLRHLGAVTHPQHVTGRIAEVSRLDVRTESEAGEVERVCTRKPGNEPGKGLRVAKPQRASRSGKGYRLSARAIDFDGRPFGDRRRRIAGA